MLLQGNVLPQQLYLAKDPLPSLNTIPAAPVQHAHEVSTLGLGLSRDLVISCQYGWLARQRKALHCRYAPGGD